MDNDNPLLQKAADLYRGLRFTMKYRGVDILPAAAGNDLARDLLESGQPFLFGRCGPQPSGRQPAALHARAGHTRPLPGGIVSQRAAAYSPLIRPCGATFPPRGKARGISTPLYAAFPPAYYSSSG